MDGRNWWSSEPGAVVLWVGGLPELVKLQTRGGGSHCLNGSNSGRDTLAKYQVPAVKVATFSPGLLKAGCLFRAKLSTLGGGSAASMDGRNWWSSEPGAVLMAHYFGQIMQFLKVHYYQWLWVRAIQGFIWSDFLTRGGGSACRWIAGTGEAIHPGRWFCCLDGSNFGCDTLAKYQVPAVKVATFSPG